MGVIKRCRWGWGYGNSGSKNLQRTAQGGLRLARLKHKSQLAVRKFVVKEHSEVRLLSFRFFPRNSSWRKLIFWRWGMINVPVFNAHFGLLSQPWSWHPGILAFILGWSVSHYLVSHYFYFKLGWLLVNSLLEHRLIGKNYIFTYILIISGHFVLFINYGLLSRSGFHHNSVFLQWHGVSPYPLNHRNYTAIQGSDFFKRHNSGP